MGVGGAQGAAVRAHDDLALTPGVGSGKSPTWILPCSRIAAFKVPAPRLREAYDRDRARCSTQPTACRAAIKPKVNPGPILQPAPG